MKTQAIAIKRSTLVSVLLVGAVIAICSATNARAEPCVPDVQAAPYSILDAYDG